MLPSKKFNRSLTLFELDNGKTHQKVGELVRKHPATISIWAKKYKENGLDLLGNKPRNGRPKELGGTTRAKIIALIGCTLKHTANKSSLIKILVVLSTQ